MTIMLEKQITLAAKHSVLETPHEADGVRRHESTLRASEIDLAGSVSWFANSNVGSNVGECVLPAKHS